MILVPACLSAPLTNLPDLSFFLLKKKKHRSSGPIVTPFFFDQISLQIQVKPRRLVSNPVQSSPSPVLLPRKRIRGCSATLRRPVPAPGARRRPWAPGPSTSSTRGETPYYRLLLQLLEMESMQERGRRERDIVVPRATCAAALASTQNEFFCLSLLCWSPSSPSSICAAASSSSIPLRRLSACASPRAPRQRGCGAINASAGLHRALPRSVVIPDSFLLHNFLLPMCADLGARAG